MFLFSDKLGDSLSEVAISTQKGHILKLNVNVGGRAQMSLIITISTTVITNTPM